jgi:hypothetical protein
VRGIGMRGGTRDAWYLRGDRSGRGAVKRLASATRSPFVRVSPRTLFARRDTREQAVKSANELGKSEGECRVSTAAIHSHHGRLVQPAKSQHR